MDINYVASKFEINESIECYSPLGNGHINVTFLLTTVNHKKYVLQKINTVAFKNVDGLMDNMQKVTSFLMSRKEETIELIKTKEGRYFYQDESGCYRIYIYIDNVICYEGVTNLEAVYNTAKAFGKLHKSLKEFPAETLCEVIPNFHNTKARYDALLKSIELDVAHRVAQVPNEIAEAKKHAELYSLLIDSINNGEIPLGVTHNDPKINNILFDEKTNNARAIIDLDTIMPGSYLYDFGDALRSLFTGQYEDTTDLTKIHVNYDVFEAYARGYLSEMKGVLSKKEIELLPFSVFLLTAELVVRFLTDYLDGDVYFHTAYPEHNLVRTRTQIKLMNDIYDNLDKLQAIINKIVSE